MKKNLGFGLGLRSEHYDDLLPKHPQVDWLEIISEGFLLDGGKSLETLEDFRKEYPIVAHGVSLSIGSVDPLDQHYLKKLKKLLDTLNCPWFSEHLCWSQFGNAHLHNLMPLPYTKEIALYVADRVKQVQDQMQRTMLLENVSSYIEFTDSQLTEWDFLTLIAETADCGILLDINNVYVSGKNHNFDPMTYINAIPPERVYQFHIAGHKDKGTHLLDTHDHDIGKDVWELYRETLKLMPHVSTMIERDDDIPPLEDLLKELETAKAYATVTA